MRHLLTLLVNLINRFAYTFSAGKCVPHPPLTWSPFPTGEGFRRRVFQLSILLRSPHGLGKRSVTRGKRQFRAGFERDRVGIMNTAIGEESHKYSLPAGVGVNRGRQMRCYSLCSLICSTFISSLHHSCEKSQKRATRFGLPVKYCLGHQLFIKDF